MVSLLCTPDLRQFRLGLGRVTAPESIGEELVRAVLSDLGEVLKDSPKTRVRRVGKLVVKESRGLLPSRLAKHTFRKSRYRQAWRAAHHLLEHDVPTPKPIAFVEWGAMGIIAGNAMITEYLPGARNVEDFLRAMVQAGGAVDTLQQFLADLARDINLLSLSGAYHPDLSGKNIFTQNGRKFYFIDLDAVEIGEGYSDEARMRNHVQLYDSFCDELSDHLMVPFIESLLSPLHDPRVWMPEVRQKQRERRRLVEMRWEKEGKLGV
ncbi:MAG: hypothetical protein HYV27_02695 [Candidatus Hydrogenedentes bacterium]|nr:hypothetical protein [Candidatus Hydrogenedentota bacterium]